MFQTLGLHADRLTAALAQPDQALALGSAAVAALLVVVSAFVRTMIPLRWLAVASNVGFIIYGLLYPNPLMVVLHAVLLPVNLWRVLEMLRITRRIRVAADPQSVALWLRPYMRSRRLRAGALVFERGALADRLYFLAEGQIDLPEVGQTLQAGEIFGEIFGEIGFFAADGRRSSSACCRTACTVLSIDEVTFRQLVFQNPAFGLELLRLVTERLSRDIRRLQSQSPRAPT